MCTECIQLIQRRLAATNPSGGGGGKTGSGDACNVADDDDVTLSNPSFKTPLRFLTNLFNFKRLISKDSTSSGEQSSACTSPRADRDSPTSGSLQQQQHDSGSRRTMTPRSPNPQRFYKTLETMKSLEKLYMSRSDDPELQSAQASAASTFVASATAAASEVSAVAANDSSKAADSHHQQMLTTRRKTSAAGGGSGLDTIPIPGTAGIATGASAADAACKSPTGSVRSAAAGNESPPVILPDSSHLIRSPPPVHKGTLTYLQGHGGAGSGGGLPPGSPFLCGSPRRDYHRTPTSGTLGSGVGHEDSRRPLSAASSSNSTGRRLPGDEATGSSWGQGDRDRCASPSLLIADATTCRSSVSAAASKASGSTRQQRDTDISPSPKLLTARARQGD